MWNNLYLSIVAANAVLVHVDGATYTDDNVKNQHIGEAETIRALSYFYLVQTFGGYGLDGNLLGVPLVTQPLTGDAARATPRSSLDSTYALIVQDLNDAKSKLPATQTGTSAGRFTSGGAQALLGKVYMFMAGYPLNKGTEYYSKAVTELQAVATNPQYSLVPSYIQLFNATNKNSSEALLEIQFKADQANGTGNAYQSKMLSSTAASALVPAGDAGTADNKPEPDLLNAYAAGDPRKSVCFRPGYKLTNGTYKAEAYGHKYWQPLGSDISNVDLYTDWGCNWKELRLAEVYLLLAEGLVRSGGDKEMAISYLNKIRERARNTDKAEDATILNIETQFPTWNVGDPTVSLADYTDADFASDDDLLLAIEKESRVEFALEDKRWYYLVRTQRAPAVMPAELAADENATITWDDRDYAIPIPQNAMLTAPGVIVQNKGYTQL
jgi:hypothetical protein